MQLQGGNLVPVGYPRLDDLYHLSLKRSNKSDINLNR